MTWELKLLDAHKEGKAEGKAEEYSLRYQLTHLLKNAGRMDDILRINLDPVYYETLLHEFGLISSKCP